MAESPPSSPSAKLSLQVGAVVFGRVVVSAIDSLKTFLLVRLLDKGAFGTLSFALTWYATAQGLGLLSIPDSLLYFLPRLQAPQQRTFVRQSMAILAVVGALIGLGIAAVAFVPGLQPQGRPELLGPLGWVALVVALDLPSGVLQSFLLGMQQHRTSALVAMGLSLAGNLALLIPSWLGADPTRILAIFAAYAGLRLAVTLTIWRRLFADVAPEPFDGGVRAQLAFSIPLSLNGMAGLVNKQLAFWAAGLLLAPAVFADFAVGAQELPVVQMLPYAVATAMLPRLSQLAAGERPAGARAALDLWHQSILKVSLVMLPVFVVSVVETETILGLAFDERYRSAALPFRWTALLIPLRVAGYGTMLMALGRPRGILTSQLLGIAVNAVVSGGLLVTARDQVLSPTTVMSCAAGGSVLATVLIVAVMLRTMAAEADVPYRRVFPWPGYLRRCGVAALASVPMLALAWLHAPDVWLAALPEVVAASVGLVVRIVVFLGSYLALAQGAGLLGDDDRRVVKQWLRLEPLWRRS